MINRVLIRIKVIQVLYSYLLVEKKFTLEEPPANPTKEKRYSYGLYIEVLSLLAMIAGKVERHRGEKPLLKTRFMERVLEDEHVEQTRRTLFQTGVFENLSKDLAEKIKESGAYKMYLKDRDKDVAGAEEVLWSNLFFQIVMTNPVLIRYAESKEGYTLKGLERMKEMMAETLTNFMSSQDTLADGLKTLAKSLDKSRELYFRLLALAVDLTDMQARRLDNARHKYLRTEEDMNPNMRFVENRVVEALRNDETFREYINNNKINWYVEDPMMMDLLLKSVLESETYKAYMEAPSSDKASDAEFWRELYKKVIFNNPNFLESLEESSVFWNDDIDIMGTFVLKTFRRIEEGKDEPILRKFKDSEDERFGSELMSFVYKGKEQYAEWIGRAVANSEWEAERLAFMDVVIIQTALAEILNFPKIPLNVSINEYIEIAKSYSSSKSGAFVHGLLSTLIDNLQKEGRLLKQ